MPKSKTTIASSNHTCGECQLHEHVCARQGKKEKHVACADFKAFQDCFEGCPFQDRLPNTSVVWSCNLLGNNQMLLNRPQRTEECQNLVTFIQLVQGLKR